MSQNAVVIDMATPAPAPAAAPAAATSATATTSSKSDTLFGPNIGVLGSGPDWAESQEKSSDVLTPEIVKGWIAKSKEVSVSVLFGAWEVVYAHLPTSPASSSEACCALVSLSPDLLHCWGVCDAALAASVVSGAAFGA